MKLPAFKIATLAFAAAACASGTAQAQYYASAQNPPPLYPYMQQQNRNAGQPFAIEVAPGQYVIHRPEESRGSRRQQRSAAPVVRPVAKAEAPKRLKTKTDPALVEELRQRVAGKPVKKPQAEPDESPQGSPKAQTSSVVNTTKYIRHKPTVNERIRYVDLPPRVVERYTVVDDSKGDKKVVVEAPQDVVPDGKPAKGGKNVKRVIQADAEITVLGPDRMTIQLYRKGERGKGARIN